jgi:hypothetical protein
LQVQKTSLRTISADGIKQANHAPHHFQPCDRIRIPLPELWNIRRTPTLVPQNASIPWTLPTL